MLVQYLHFISIINAGVVKCTAVPLQGFNQSKDVGTSLRFSVKSAIYKEVFTLLMNLQEYIPVF